MKKNILIVTSEFPPQPGGIGNHAYYLALYLSKKEYSVSVIADQRDVDNQTEVAFDASLPFVVKRIGLRKVRWLMYVNRIIVTLMALKSSDEVIATGKFPLWNVAFSSLFFKCYKIAVIHGTEVNFKSSLLRRAIDISLKRFNVIVAVSQYTAGLISHLEREIQVIPNGIDLNEWQRSKTTEIKLTGSPVMTTVGRVSLRKGQLEVIKLLPQLKKKYPNIHYHCIGIPTEADAFLDEAKALGVDLHVTFHGAVDDDTLKEMLLATDVFVMLSIESSTGDVEGFGIAILEANALGIPALGSKGCGIEDAIKDGVSGFLVDGTDGSAFVSRIDTLLSHHQRFKQGAEWWAKKHDWNEIVKQYMVHL